MNVSRPGTIDNMIQYQCTASNGVESTATAMVHVTVYCKSFHVRLLVPFSLTLTCSMEIGELLMACDMILNGTVKF